MRRTRIRLYDTASFLISQNGSKLSLKSWLALTILMSPRCSVTDEYMGILRVIYALIVFFSHTGWLRGFVIFPDPIKAVFSFFIISGFYMSFILNKKYVGNKSSYMLFISNRFLRIYPIYWIVLLLSILFSAVLIWLRIDSRVDTGFSYYLRYYAFLLHKDVVMLPVAIASDVIRNVTILIHCGYFVRCADASRFLNTTGLVWSLNYELLFYLIAPFLLRRKGLGRLGVIAGIFLMWYLLFHFNLLRELSTAWIFVSALVFFVLGYISFILYEKLPLKKIPSIVLYAICLLFYVFAVLYFHVPLPHFQYRWINITDYIYYLVIVSALPFLFQFSNLIRFDAFIGQLSYPIYISHALTNAVLLSTGIVKPNTQVYIYIALICTIIFSLAVTYLLENPIDRYRQKRLAAVKST